MINELFKKSMNRINACTITKGFDNLKNISLMYFDSADKDIRYFLYVDQVDETNYHVQLVKKDSTESKVLDDLTISNFDDFEGFNHFIVRTKEPDNSSLNNYTKRKFLKISDILDDLEVSEYQLKWKYKNKIYINLLNVETDKHISVITSSTVFNGKLSNDIEIKDIHNNVYCIDNNYSYDLKSFIKPLFDYQKEIFDVRKSRDSIMLCEIERLQKEKRELEQKLFESEQIQKAEKVIKDDLIKQNNEYFDALVFYSLPDTYRDIFIHSKRYSSIEKDKGKQARIALKINEDFLNK